VGAARICIDAFKAIAKSAALADLGSTEIDNVRSGRTYAVQLVSVIQAVLLSLQCSVRLLDVKLLLGSDTLSTFEVGLTTQM
jgi:hypothetical protein